MNNSKLKRLLITSAVLILLFTNKTLYADDEHRESKACEQTTKFALKACRADATRGFWIARGNCSNITNQYERSLCKKRARTDRFNAKTLCKAQRTARDAICNALGNDPYDPDINPNNFLDVNGIIANPNPYFPLIPGNLRRYRAGDEEIEVLVTHDTKQILGVTCVVVRDTVTVDGVLVEDTDDWYAQDIHGNVWYMGELARNYDEGELVDLDGSWQAGVDGAKAGIIMQAIPEVGNVYRQEFYLAEAEDMGEVIDVTGSAKVPAANCENNCVVTRDFLPIEPGVNEHKYYAPGIGPILIINLETGERDELVEFITP